jgi:transcription initiation factor TFIIB
MYNIESDACNDYDICNMDDDELFNLMEAIDYENENDYENDYENENENENENKNKNGNWELAHMGFNKDHKQIVKYNKSTNIKHDKLFCIKCNSTDNIVEESSCGIVVCYTCGSVISTIVDQTIEQKIYSEDTKNTLERCSGITSIFLPQTSLGTTIGGGPMNRLKKLQQWSAMPYKEKSLYNVLKTIQTKCRANNILKCIEDDAKILYKNISESKHESGKNKGKVIIIRGTNRKSLVAACVFYACKRKGKSRGPKEIATIFEIEYKDLTKGCKIFKKLMKMKYMPYDIQIAKPDDFILDYCKKLNMNKVIIDQAITISQNIQKLNIATMHTPVSAAIGSILVIMRKNNYPINKNNIAKKFNVSAVTVSKSQKQITEYGDLLLNTELVDKIAQKAEEARKKITMPFKFQLMYDKVVNKSNNITLEYLKKDNNLSNYIGTIIDETDKMVAKTNEAYLKLGLRRR